MNINQLFYWDNAQQEFSKNQVFKNKLFDLSYSKEIPENSA